MVNILVNSGLNSNISLTEQKEDGVSVFYYIDEYRNASRVPGTPDMVRRWGEERSIHHYAVFSATASNLNLYEFEEPADTPEGAIVRLQSTQLVLENGKVHVNTIASDGGLRKDELQIYLEATAQANTYWRIYLDDERVNGQDGITLQPYTQIHTPYIPPITVPSGTFVITIECGTISTYSGGQSEKKTASLSWTIENGEATEEETPTDDEEGPYYDLYVEIPSWYPQTFSDSLISTISYNVSLRFQGKGWTLIGSELEGPKKAVFHLRKDGSAAAIIILIIVLAVCVSASIMFVTGYLKKKDTNQTLANYSDSKENLFNTLRSEFIAEGMSSADATEKALGIVNALLADAGQALITAKDSGSTDWLTIGGASLGAAGTVLLVAGLVYFISQKK